ncbi:Neutral/alkaline nonlysosomal ceramidase [Coniella lustricola]|uniref:Neutral ceramidase n=1 Tax=Coniella lustricola TaxID=2025994 RepID=A0A2T2ZRS2_9PEZI|nr:Neutral/alkaline nonlysosomal ceramidase [Coniella lustricola]
MDKHGAAGPNRGRYRPVEADDSQQRRQHSTRRENGTGSAASSPTAATAAVTPWLALLLVLLPVALYCSSLASLSAHARLQLPWFEAGDGRDHSPEPLLVPHGGDRYLLGVGKADITGPVVEVNLMGYADPSQVGSGLRQRLYSRAFIVGDVARPADRFVYLVLDTQSGDTAVRYGILAGLADLGPEYAVYGQHNVAVTGTHSHSGPGGWLNYLLPQITSKGFHHQGYRAIVDGALLSIVRAHESLQPGYLSVGAAKVHGANINRSLFAYLANPETERARYNLTTDDDGSVDKDLSLVKFQRASDGKNIGVLTWFPTHGTSMLGNNTIVTGDNKGVAAYLFEQSVRGDATAADAFVAGFSQANVGDTSPNVLGAWCEDGSGQMCSLENSTCPGDAKVGKCHARGPLFRADDKGASSCFEIGRRQFAAARAVYDQSTPVAPVPIRGSWVKSFHTFHDMANFTFQLPNGSIASTCPAALGYAFAAGTSDGPGVFDFTQHDGDASNTSPVWKVVSKFLKDPSDEQRACQGSKPILLDVGEVHKPYDWTPNIVDVQAFRVGQLVIVVSPGEATTMAGRRWKDAVQSESAALFQHDDDDDNDAAVARTPRPAPIVVLGGPANSYTHYIATEQEYGIQRYEGASTLYGPHTLAAYINVTLDLLPFLDASVRRPPPPSGVLPPDNVNRSLSFITGVVRDGTPLGKDFGEVKQDVDAVYSLGDRVSATFVGANPRNNLHLEGTYAAVERLVLGRPQEKNEDEAGDEDEDREQDSGGGGDQVWQTVRDDADWSLLFEWKRTSDLLGTSEVKITWETDREVSFAGGPRDHVPSGVYRLRYFGDSKSLGGTITPFEGTSAAFTLV